MPALQFQENTMKCPACVEHELRPVLTKQGIEIDYCEKCQGIWLDKGEIYSFTKRRKELAAALQEALKHPKFSSRLSPKTGAQMQEIAFLGGELMLDYCPETEGLWCDQGEIEKLVKAAPRMLSIGIDQSMKEGVTPEQERPAPGEVTQTTTLLRLPGLGLSSAIALMSLAVMPALFLILVALFPGLTAGTVLILGVLLAGGQCAVSPWLLDHALRRFSQVQWQTAAQLPAHLQKFVTRVCTEQGMQIPRFGLINDDGPNLFTYGHTPDTARIVLTRGIFERLAEQEVEAVVAHEFEHATHWNMPLMTAAQLVPFVLSSLYRTLLSSERTRSKTLCAVGVYLLYRLSEYPLLWFSRRREYRADRFAAEITQNPNSLASALVKIAYGLAGQGSDNQEDTRSHSLEALGAFGIFDTASAQAFTVSAHTADEDVVHTRAANRQKAHIAGALKWDIWNPWAKYYEFHSTHPLMAKRLHYLSNQAQASGQTPFLRLSLKKPESYWDDFWSDLLIMVLPVLTFLAAVIGGLVTGQQVVFGLGVLITGIFSLVKLFSTYPFDEFPMMTISGLLKYVKVSGIRAVPCQIQGIITGRGVPGLIWSEDFILKDHSGIIFLDYRHPLRLWEFFFGLMRSKHIQRTQVIAEGWYRRSPVPYIELKSLRTADKTRKCYVYTLKMIWVIFLVIAGFIAAFVPVSTLMGLF